MNAASYSGLVAFERSENDTAEDLPTIVDVRANETVFGIRAADIDQQRSSASMLISKMYSWRGYAGDHQLRADPRIVTLTATTKQGAVIGTVTLRLDSAEGLFADQVFKDCIHPYRREGAVCELTKLAFDPQFRSKEVLAALFHVAFIYAKDLHSCSNIFIEVNPRHRRFYEVMLDFQVECSSRQNPRVQAPAVLLRGDVAHGRKRVVECAGKGEHAVADRSLFPYFFSPREEEGIIRRLKNLGLATPI